MLSSHLSSPQSKISYWRGFFAPGCSAGYWPLAGCSIAEPEEGKLDGEMVPAPGPGPSHGLSIQQCSGCVVAMVWLLGSLTRPEHRRPALLCRNAPARGKENLKLISINSMSKATPH